MSSPGWPIVDITGSRNTAGPRKRNETPMIKITAGIAAALATAAFAIATPAVALATTDTGAGTRVSAPPGPPPKSPARAGPGEQDK